VAFDENCFYGNNVKYGGKIILPETLLNYYSKLTVQYPMMFEIIKNNERVRCGVLEFTSPTGQMQVPQWMMTQLKISDGEQVFIKYLELKKGTWIQFQPHSSDFFDINDHKSVLERCLVNFASISINDTIPIYHEDKVFYGQIVDSKPSSSISIIDCDLEVDFKLPKDYQEPKTKLKEKSLETTEERIETNLKAGDTPNYEYKAGFLSFPQDSFKQVKEKKELIKEFIPFQGAYGTFK